ncbi:MAG: nucleoside 2-deoxyribosyltransferase [Candidatus Marinimicrobia bacterium]|nr:nucleoside 2-deoxyribosyltransferase [Candidatus Neomarinimicrobiota bacterium]
MGKCFVCNNEVKIIDRLDIDSYDVECPTCGKYRINRTSASCSLKDKYKMYLLSGALRFHSELGRMIEVDTSNINDIISSVPKPNSPIESIDFVIRYILKNMKYAGDLVSINPITDYSICFAHNSDEFLYILDMMNNLGYIENPYEDYSSRLTYKGWQYSISLKDKIDSNQVFVAMWFDKKVSDLWTDGIEPILNELGYNPVRIDKMEHNEKICDKIIAEIKRSRLLIADFTGQRQGVYFEAGFAMGFGIPVIWTCNKNDVDKLHFDTRQYNHIIWENPNDLREKLKNRIKAIIE